MAYPTGYTQQQIVSVVQARTNEPTLPSAATLITLINDSAEEVVSEIGGVIANTSIAVTNGQTSVPLPEDVLTISGVWYSATAPLTAGWVPYEIQLFDPKQFQDYSIGVPLVSSGGPSYAASIITDTAGVMTLELAPPSTAGFLWVVYEQRVQLWDPANGNSTTNIDTLVQKAIVYKACSAVCEALENLVKAKYFGDKYEAMEEKIKRQMRRRQRPQSTQVRDVLSGPIVGPSWYPWSG